MYLILAETLPQPVSQPVHYSGLQYLLAYVVVALVGIAIVAVMYKAEPELAKPRIIIVFVILMMFCLPLAILYLVRESAEIRANKQQ